MTVWIIEPRDPLIVRDGRPFGPDPGVRAVSLAFPFPSTTTGALRTQAGLNEHGIFTQTQAQLADLKKIAVRGPLLVELDNRDQIADWLLPAPADALLFDKDDQHPKIIRQLVPLKLQADEYTDLPDDLAPVGLPSADPRKPKKDAPAFWRWNYFKDWLLNPHNDSPIPDDLGHAGPTRESRIHIQQDPRRGASEEGKLFETSGLEFTCGGKDRQTLSAASRLALAIVSDHEIPHPQAVDTLGGERRLAMWRRSECALPKHPPELIECIVKQRACRLILLTPACFSEGYCPTWLLQPRHGVTPQMLAAAVGRPHVVSGWDYEKKRPKPTRHLTPAGSVYFLKLSGDADAIRTWVKETWMQCVSDDAKDQPNKDQDRIDGFGLAVLGMWDGKSQICTEETCNDS